MTFIIFQSFQHLAIRDMVLLQLGYYSKGTTIIPIVEDSKYPFGEDDPIWLHSAKLT